MTIIPGRSHRASCRVQLRPCLVWSQIGSSAEALLSDSVADADCPRLDDARVDPVESEPYEQERIPYWYAPLKDEQTGRWITSHVVNQDFVAWVGQGTVADRTREHLGESDRGVILLRRRLLEEAAKVQRGEEPKAIIRDPAQNECVVLPTSGYEQLTAGVPRQQAKTRLEAFKKFLGIDDYFPFFARQPEAVRREFLDAMGFDDEARIGQPHAAVAADD